jgi:hypothetical protein
MKSKRGPERAKNMSMCRTEPRRAGKKSGRASTSADVSADLRTVKAALAASVQMKLSFFSSAVRGQQWLEIP